MTTNLWSPPLKRYMGFAMKSFKLVSLLVALAGVACAPTTALISPAASATSPTTSAQLPVYPVFPTTLHLASNGRGWVKLPQAATLTLALWIQRCNGARITLFAAGDRPRLLVVAAKSQGVCVFRVNDTIGKKHYRPAKVTVDVETTR